MKERAPVKEALWTRTALSLAVLVLVGVLSGVEAQDRGELHTHTQRHRVRGDFSNSERLLYQSLASTIQYYIKPLITIAMCVHNFDIQLVYL